MVSLLLGRFSDETVRDHRIDAAELTLSSFPSRTCPEAIQNKWMRVMISMVTKARAGRDFAMELETLLSIIMEFGLVSQKYKVSDYSILHMATAAGDVALVKALVSVGADVSSLTGASGDLQCSPLHLAVMTGRADLAEYLVQRGSDLELEGCVIQPDSPFGFTRVVRERMRDGGDPLRFGRFNALELLLQLGLERSAPTLERMLSSGRVGFHGADELRLAVSGRNVDFLRKVFAAVGGAVGAEELQWISVWDGEKEVTEPLFQQLVNNVKIDLYSIHRLGMTEWCLTTLLHSFVSRGYDCNAVGDGGESQLFPVLHLAAYFGGGDFLLKAFLNSGNHHLEINNVRNKSGESPVQFLLREWNGRCSQTLPCFTHGDWQPDVLTLLTLLLEHGASVSGLEIGAETKYHWGYGDLIKLLYSAGAKVKPEFFEDPLCGWGGGGGGGGVHPEGSGQQQVLMSSCHHHVLREVDELREWVSSEGEKKMRLNLKVLCRSAIRSSVRRVGDLQKLENHLPPSLRDYVAMKEELKDEEESLEDEEEENLEEIE